MRYERIIGILILWFFLLFLAFILIAGIITASEAHTSPTTVPTEAERRAQQELDDTNATLPFMFG